MYAITNSGWRAVTDDSTEADLKLGETLVEELPQWLLDAVLAAQALERDTAIEDAWRVSELAAIADQLAALEDDDPARLPGTDAEWRAHRIRVRAWKEGNENFPHLAQRPIRPA